MGSNTSRKQKVFVSNKVVANTGTTVPTITNDDVLILDRGLVALSSDTITSDAKNDLFYVALGIGSTGESIIESIQTRNVRKITVQKYVAPTQRAVVIESDNFELAANTDYAVQIVFHDNHFTFNNAPTRQYFVYTSGATVPTKAEIVDALVLKINAAKLSYVTASNVSDDLKLIGKAVAANSINTYQYVNFEVIMRSGFKTTATKANTLTYSGGLMGQGVGQVVKDMELENTNNLNRIMWPIAEDTRRATNGGYYNLVVIEHGNVTQGDLLDNYTAPRTLVVAFAAAVTDGDTAYAGTGTVLLSTKAQAFIDALESLTESALVFVE